MALYNVRFEYVSQVEAEDEDAARQALFDEMDSNMGNGEVTIELAPEGE